MEHRDVEHDLQEMIEHEIVLGFSDDQEIVDDALLLFRGSDEATVRATLAAALAARAIDERGWPAATDCDRLDEAFAALESEGVVARQNFWCCGTCACRAIDDEMIDEEARGTAVRGYVLFHRGTLDNAVAGHTLGLQCGGAIDDDDDDEVSARIAERVLHAVKRAGLEATQEGRVVEVEIDWKRRRKHRRPSDAPSMVAHLASWEASFAAESSAAVPRARPQELGPTLVATGAHALAARWASRAGSVTAVAITARALAAKGDDARARELFLGEYRRYPSVVRLLGDDRADLRTRGPALAYLELILRGGLADDIVARVAATRVGRLPPTLFSAAAKAWLACAMRDAGRPVSPHDERDWIGGAQVIWSQDEEAPAEVLGADEARVALAAALWSYLPAGEAGKYEDAAFGWIGAEPIELARMATFRAAASSGDAASLLDEVPDAAALELLEALVEVGVEVGEAEPARALLSKLSGPERTLGLLALGDLPPADVEATKAEMGRLQSDYEEGLLTTSERERGQLVALYALAASGEPSAAAELLAPMLEEPLALALGAVAGARARLDEAAGSSFAIDWAARTPPMFTEAWTPASERRLTRALGELEAARRDYEVQSRLRTIAQSLVKLAAADRERAGRLLADLRARWPDDPWRPRCVEVLMALGRIDEALELDRARLAVRGEPAVSLELARRLLLAGRRDEALERLVARMDFAQAEVLLDMGLMLLTLSEPENRGAVAARLRAAFDRASASLDELSPRGVG